MAPTGSTVHGSVAILVPGIQRRCHTSETHYLLSSPHPWLPASARSSSGRPPFPRVFTHLSSLTVTALHVNHPFQPPSAAFPPNHSPCLRMPVKRRPEPSKQKHTQTNQPINRNPPHCPACKVPNAVLVPHVPPCTFPTGGRVGQTPAQLVRHLEPRRHHAYPTHTHTRGSAPTIPGVPPYNIQSSTLRSAEPSMDACGAGQAVSAQRQPRRKHCSTCTGRTVLSVHGSA